MASPFKVVDQLPPTQSSNSIKIGVRSTAFTVTVADEVLEPLLLVPVTP
jgi:hypothetical protein